MIYFDTPLSQIQPERAFLRRLLCPFAISPSFRNTSSLGTEKVFKSHIFPSPKSAISPTKPIPFTEGQYSQSELQVLSYCCQSFAAFESSQQPKPGYTCIYLYLSLSLFALESHEFIQTLPSNFSPVSLSIFVTSSPPLKILLPLPLSLIFNGLIFLI